MMPLNLEENCIVDTKLSMILVQSSSFVISKSGTKWHQWIFQASSSRPFSIYKPQKNQTGVHEPPYELSDVLFLKLNKSLW